MPVLLIPVHNEQRHLPGVLEKAARIASTLVVVDDGSTDATPGLLVEWARQHPRCHLLLQPVNRGKSQALAQGLRVVDGLVQGGQVEGCAPLVLCDGDGQHDLEEVPPLCESLSEQQLDMLIAYRDFSRYPRHKVWGNRLLSWQARWLTGVAYVDSLCGLRVMRAGRAGEVATLLTGPRYTCEQQMCVGLPRRGWRVANNFPVAPAHARSNPSWWDGAEIFCWGLASWLRGLRARSAPIS
ncbi:MAG: glycosyltransferase family 2 protein [Candidatus Eremiobacterota bacterium]